jgi:hypothetical protein
MSIATKVYETSGRMLGIAHRITLQLGLCVWQLLNVQSQVCES